MAVLVRCSAGALALSLGTSAFAQAPAGGDGPFQLRLSLDHASDHAVRRLHLAQPQLILTMAPASEGPAPPVSPPPFAPIMKSVLLQVGNQPGYLQVGNLTKVQQLTLAATALGVAAYFLLNDSNAKAYRNLQDTALPEPSLRPPPPGR